MMNLSRSFLAFALSLAATSAWAQGLTINQLDAGSALSGSELIPMFQNANPVVTTTPAAIATYTATYIGGPFLPLSGGTMSGNIAMGGNAITGISNLVVAPPSSFSVSSGQQAFANSITTSDLIGGIGLIQNNSGTATSVTNPGGSGFNFNNIRIVESVNNGSGFVGGLVVQDLVQTGANGGREVLSGVVTLNTALSGQSNQAWVGVNGLCEGYANVGGTSGTPVGACYGGGFTFQLGSTGTHYVNATAAEFNSAANTGSSVSQKSIIQLSGRADDAVAGSTLDTMIWMYNQGGAPVSHNYGIYIDNNGGGGNWPIASTGTVFATGGSGSAANGTDYSNTTFSGCAFKGVGYCVNGSGLTTGTGLVATAVAPTVSSNQIGYGSTVAAATSCGSLSSAAGCIVVNVGGTARYVPYY